MVSISIGADSCGGGPRLEVTSMSGSADQVTDFPSEDLDLYTDLLSAYMQLRMSRDTSTYNKSRGLY